MRAIVLVVAFLALLASVAGCATFRGKTIFPPMGAVETVNKVA